MYVTSKLGTVFLFCLFKFYLIKHNKDVFFTLGMRTLNVKLFKYIHKIYVLYFFVVEIKFTLSYTYTLKINNT